MKDIKEFGRDKIIQNKERLSLFVLSHAYNSELTKGIFVYADIFNPNHVGVKYSIDIWEGVRAS